MTRRRRAVLLLPLLALVSWSDPPPVPSKKGLGVQMIDDALSLGIAHATLNVQIGDLLVAAPQADDVIVACEGQEVRFAAQAAAALDLQVEPLAAAGVRVYLILLARATGDPARDALILHRHVDHAGEGGLRLGLWTRKEGTLCAPDWPRRMHEVFRLCHGPGGEEALRFALPVIGIQDWGEVVASEEGEQG
ncbi:MAG: hypothetical protein HY812_03595 [Planctomycetes bacterium]|nr:hypothetical protein [Planctomycetota bacterium]